MPKQKVFQKQLVATIYVFVIGQLFTKHKRTSAVSNTPPIEFLFGTTGSFVARGIIPPPPAVFRLYVLSFAG